MITQEAFRRYLNISILSGASLIILYKGTTDMINAFNYVCCIAFSQSSYILHMNMDAEDVSSFSH